jgi:hypothetical protein
MYTMREREPQCEEKDFMCSEIYKNWSKYHDKYKKILSEEDIINIKQQLGSINHEIEGACSHNGRFGPLYILEKLFLIQKRIATDDDPIHFEL